MSKGVLVTDATVFKRTGAALATLTPTHQRMAEYVLANPFCTTTIRTDKFAATVDMSIATANRFTLALGSDGYPQFRAGLLRGFEATLTPVEKLRHELARSASSAEIFVVSLNEDIANLDAARHMLDAAMCERTVDAIFGVQRICVMGFGASGYLMGLLCRGLDLYRDMVIAVSQLDGASDATRQLHKIGPKGLLIAIIFPRYTADIIALAKQVDKQDCQLLAPINNSTSPLAPLADTALYVRPEWQFSATSDTAAVALFGALYGAVTHRSVYSLESVEHLTEFVLPWLHMTPAPRTDDASGTSGTPITTRCGRKHAVEN